MTIERTGDTLTIDGEALDLSGVGEGDSLPQEAIDHPALQPDTPGVWHVERTNGELSLHIKTPFYPGSPHEALFPEPIEVSGDGPVVMPPYDAPEVSV